MKKAIAETEIELTEYFRSQFARTRSFVELKKKCHFIPNCMDFFTHNRTGSTQTKWSVNSGELGMA